MKRILRAILLGLALSGCSTLDAPIDHPDGRNFYRTIIFNGETTILRCDEYNNCVIVV